MRHTLVVILCAVFAGATHTGSDQLKNLHRHMTRSQLLETFEVSNHNNVPEYDVTHPYQSTSDGKFLSYDMHNDHRVKRYVTDGHHYYSLSAFGKTLHLKLKENKDLVPPGLAMEDYTGGKVKRTLLTPSIHYFGHVLDHPGSSVAISNHGALSGKITLQDDTYYIRPSPEGFLQGAVDSTPHFVYKQTKNEMPFEDIAQAVQGVSSTIDSANDPSALSSGNKNYLEVAMVTVEEVAKKYGNRTSDVLLSVANLVAQAFQDPSIGENKIVLVVTKLIIITSKELNATSLSTGDQLNAIQRWAIHNNPTSDSDPKHADIVSLMRASSGGGLASLGTVCKFKASANVISSNGLQSWGVMAHEIAHNLGIGHDGAAQCPNGVNIMATSVPGGDGSYFWSSCSKDKFTKLFSENKYTCFKDFPQATSLPTLPPLVQDKKPGVVMDRTRQCQLRGGPNAIACSQKRTDCSSLWCSTAGSTSCTSNVAAPVDGTRCGVRNWCIKAKCVDDGSPIIHGGWTNWSSMTECNRPCGGGIKFRTRTCTNPPPQNGGDKCTGEAKGFTEVCNIQECPPGKPSFRTEQCQRKAGKDKEAWHSKRNCYLWCRTKGSLSLLGYGTVEDGTRCDTDKTNHDVCIAGKCMPVGCDLKMSSTAKHDRCGVCNGDGSSCQQVNGSFTEDYRTKGIENAALIVLLPVGTTQVFVKERGYTWNNIVLKDTNDTLLYKIPGQTVIKYYAGTKIIAGRGGGNFTDKLYIQGPLRKPIKVMYWSRYGKNVGVDYTFYRPISKPTQGPSLPPTKVPSQGPPSVTTQGPSERPPLKTTQGPTQGPGTEKPPKPTKFKWLVGKWSECSQTCAGGQKTRNVSCIRTDDQTLVGDQVCSQIQPISYMACNKRRCPPEWHRSDWLPCSVTCGEGVQTRLVYCDQKINSTYHRRVPDRKCKSKKKPTDLSRPCNLTACPPQWEATPWGQCSTTCDKGIMARSIECVLYGKDGNRTVVEYKQCLDDPSFIQTEAPCNEDNPCQGGIAVEIPIACFRDRRNTLKNKAEVLADFSDVIDWQFTHDIIVNCSILAKDYGYSHFALGNNGICYSGIDFGYEYYRGKGGKKRFCKDGIGLKNHYFVYRLDPLPEFHDIGCYNVGAFDNKYYASFRGQINWNNMGLTIEQCAHVAYDMGKNFFGVHYYGECFGAEDESDVEEKLSGLDNPNKCWHGVGMSSGDNAYMFDTFSAISRK